MKPSAGGGYLAHPTCPHLAEEHWAALPGPIPFGWLEELCSRWCGPVPFPRGERSVPQLGGGAEERRAFNAYFFPLC